MFVAGNLLYPFFGVGDFNFSEQIFFMALVGLYLLFAAFFIWGFGGRPFSDSGDWLFAMYPIVGAYVFLAAKWASEPCGPIDAVFGLIGDSNPYCQ